MLSGGIVVDLNNLDPNLITIENIAGPLSKLCRFNGQISKFYSVAEHCIRCTHYARTIFGSPDNVCLSILLHDAAEAFCGDVIRPIKYNIGKKYLKIEENITKSIEKAFKVDLTSEYMKREIRWIDNKLYFNENRCLRLGFEPEYKFLSWCNFDKTLTPDEAYDSFIRLYNKYNDNK